MPFKQGKRKKNITSPRASTGKPSAYEGQIVACRGSSRGTPAWGKENGGRKRSDGSLLQANKVAFRKLSNADTVIPTLGKDEVQIVKSRWLHEIGGLTVSEHFFFKRCLGPSW